MRRVLAGLAIGLGVLLVLVSVVDDTPGGGFGWEPVLQFTAGGLIILLGLYMRPSSRDSR